MDGQEKSDLNDHESTSKEQKESTANKVCSESKVVKSFQKLIDRENVASAKDTKVNIDPLETGYNVDQLYEPGPSRIHLPGAVQHSPKVHLRTHLSKSENSIPQIITAKDVANALKHTSISYRTTNVTPLITNLHLNDLKIPVETKNRNNSDQSDKQETNTTTSEFKNIMTSCFKISKEPSIIQALPEVVVHKNHTNNVANQQQNKADSSNVAVTAQTDNEIIKADEVLNKPLPGLDTKASKTTENSKKSGNLSERSDLILAQRDSLSSIGSNVCRICMTRGRERLISPCNCKGSLANVHLSCLERWLNQVGRNHCELCGFCYPAIRTPRYTVLQALRLWFGNPRNRSHLQSDCLIFWLLSTVTAGLLAVCIVGTQYFVIEGSKFGKLDGGARKYEGISHRITETAMDFFMTIVLCGYSVTVYLLWKDHYVMWNRWRRANVNVRLLLSQDADPVPFVPRQQQRYNV